MSRNRLANANNIYQTPAKRVLTVCSAGLLRSPTIANVLHKEYGYNTRACGLMTEFALIPIDNVLVAWAEEIVTAESWMASTIEETFDIGTKRLISLNIPDEFDWMNPTLQELIKESYKTS